jgi:universal stress protein A
MMKTQLLPIPASRLSSTDRTCDAKESNRLVAYRRLLVAIDFSEHSKKTIEYAMQLAAFTGASLRILHVCPIPGHPAACYHGLHFGNDLVKSLTEMANREANEKLSLVTEEILAKGLKAQSILRVGSPYEEIVSVAKAMRAELIVIGSHGNRGFGGLLLGSTAERVLQYSPCAVLVVKDLAPGCLAARHTDEAPQD